MTTDMFRSAGAKAMGYIRALPEGSAWSFHVTSEDGIGDDPTCASLILVVPVGCLPSLDGWSPDADRNLYTKLDGILEVSIEEDAGGHDDDDD